MATNKIRFDIEANSDAAQKAVAALRKTFETTVNALKKQQGDVALFKAAQRDAAALERQINALGRAGGDTSALTGVLNAQRASLAQQAASLRQAGVNTNALASEQVRLRLQTDQVTRSFNQQSAALNASNASFRGSASAASGATSSFANYAAALVSVGAAARGINAITTAGTQLQALNSTLLFATGSAENAASAYAFVRAEAERLGLPLGVLGKQFGQLSAAASGTNLEGEATRKIFTSVASAARVMGLSTSQVERALLAVQQIMSKGNVQAEELRGQLGEQIPGAFNIAARAMRVTTTELNNMLKAGEVLSDDFLPKFAAELQRTVDPAVPAAVKTYAAEIERLKNTFTLFLQEVGESGALEAISAQVVIVTQKLQEMSDSGELKPAIDQIVGALSLLASGLAELAEFVAKNSQTLLTLAGAFAVLKAAQIGLGLANTIAQFGQMKIAIDATAVSATKLSGALKGFAFLAVLTFTVDKLTELVGVMREANKAEEDLNNARRKRNDDADLAILLNSEYADTVTRTAAQVKAASEKEQAAYAASLKSAIAYYEGLSQLAGRNAGSTDEVPQAATDAQRQANIYRRALREFDGISDARLKLETNQAAAIKKIKEAETATIELAVEAQIAAVKKARNALLDSEKVIAGIAKRTAEFQKEFEGASKPKSEKSETPVTDVTKILRTATKAKNEGDNEGALKAVEDARSLIKELVETGQVSSIFLSSLVREAGQIAEQAGEGIKKEAEAKLQDEENKLLTLKSLAEEISRLNITANVEAAEKEMQALHARTQAFYSANPLILKVVTQRQDDIALGIEKAPARAHGGPIRGPGSATSDSILARLSDGEYVVRAAAVKKLGLARLHAINQGRIPAFADGGLIARSVAGLPQISGRGGDGGARNILNLTVPEFGTFETRVTDAVAAQIERTFRVASLQHGRRK